MMNPCLLSFQRVIGTLDTLRTQYQWLRGVLRDCRSPQVFCHNDLLCGNLIYNEDSGVVGVAIKVVGVTSMCCGFVRGVAIGGASGKGRFERFCLHSHFKILIF